jgi:hypothetical protein
MQKQIYWLVTAVAMLASLGCESCFPRLFRGDRAQQPQAVCLPVCSSGCDGGCDSGCSSCGSGGGCGCGTPSVSTGVPTLGPATYGPVPGPAVQQ